MSNVSERAPEPSTPPHTTWLFVRHGQSVANSERWYSGQIDSPLTALGRQQARDAAATLDPYTIDACYASTLSRAYETAELLLADRPIPLTAHPELQERSSGDWGGRSVDDITRDQWIACYHSWHGRPPGGESLAETAERALGFLKTIDIGGTRLVVAHGAVIRAIILVIDGVSPDDLGTWRPQNCELVERTLEMGRMAELWAQVVGS